MIDKIKEFAHDQFTNEKYDGIGIGHNGRHIIDPWMDPSARFELDTKKAIQTYGLENILIFVDKVAEEIFLPGMPEVLLMTLEGLQIWRHGSNDYAIGNQEFSVRGTRRDISLELDSVIPFWDSFLF